MTSSLVRREDCHWARSTKHRWHRERERERVRERERESERESERERERE